MEIARSSYPNLLINTRRGMAPGSFTAKRFKAGIEQAINLYQQSFASQIAPTAPNFAAGMTVLTGQPSTSEWTRQEIGRLEEPKLQELFATLGVALLFISEATFVFPDEKSDGANREELVVRCPPLSPKAKISFAPSSTHIIIDPEISGKEAGELFFQGSGAFFKHLAWCLLATSFGKDRRVRDNERVDSEEKGGWGQPSTATVEVQDEPPRKGGWGEESTPGKTHMESRIEFKGNYYNRPDQVTVIEKGW